MPKWASRNGLWRSRPAAVVEPEQNEAAAAVAEAAATSPHRVLAAGGRYASGPVCRTRGTVLRTSRLTDITWQGGTDVVRVGAGVTMKTLVGELRARGRALHDVSGPEQATVGGVIACGDRGRSAGPGTWVRALSLVGADGTTTDAAEGSELRSACVGGFGAFGVITAATIATVDDFSWSLTRWVGPVPAAVERWHGAATDGEIAEFSHVPRSDLAGVTIFRRVAVNSDQTVPERIPGSWRPAAARKLPAFAGRFLRSAVPFEPTDELIVPWWAGIEAYHPEATTAWVVPLASAVPAIHGLVRELAAAPVSVTDPVTVTWGLPGNDIWSGSGPVATIRAAARLPGPFERHVRAVGAVALRMGWQPQWSAILPSDLPGATGDLRLQTAPNAVAAELRAQIDPDGTFEARHVAGVLGLGADG